MKHCDNFETDVDYSDKCRNILVIDGDYYKYIEKSGNVCRSGIKCVTLPQNRY